MNGWMWVCLLAIIQFAAAVWLVRRAARRWWDYLIVAALAVVLGRPLFDLVGADVSRYLPFGLWSDGADGKDQFIMASITATLLLPVICAAIGWLIATRIWRNMR